MLRKASLQLLSASQRRFQWLKIPCATYKNQVSSDALAQMEHQCEIFCPVPRVPPQKVTIAGAASDVGQIVSLMLKQQQIIKTLAMYDENPHRKVLGIANDVAHIDTSTAVEGYQGRPYLREALCDADVVLICGGWYCMPPCLSIDKDIFFQNMQFVRTVCLACAHFCPQAIICVQTPPVDSNFTLCKHTLEIYHAYDKRRLLGVNSINAMRANQFYAAAAGLDPNVSYVPVICGTGRCTCVPVFSNCTDFVCVDKTKISSFNRLVREADEMICRLKCNYEQGHLSIGFATARFVVNVMKGLFEKESFLDSALVEQSHPEICFNMPICASPVMVGKSGISAYLIPKVNASEQKLLEESKCDFKDLLNLGKCYALGDEYRLADCKVWIPPPPPPPCPVCKPCESQISS